MSQVVSKSKCDIVTENIINEIISGTYPIDSRLPTENELCEKYGVSRITIRESLTRLSSLGAVSIKQGRGTFVSNIDVGMFMSPFLSLIDFTAFDIGTIYDARLYLETGTCRLAARKRTEEDVKMLKHFVEQMFEDIKNRNIPHLVEFDTQFHIKIAEASGNQLLKASVINLERISKACAIKLNKIYDTFDIMDESAEQHRRIALAIEQKDEDAAEKAIVEHTLLSKEHFLR